ncbi:YqhR family membrane protein [Bacillus fonticola]|uniref:YqhR family membrane protein n=1 Tax=Bacillus fonticola TaxID=2728853 RepID=UPI0014757D70|nr:YqhR family membrane protein [Bacillus fonticola]
MSDNEKETKEKTTDQDGHQKEQNKQEEPMSFLATVILTGFIGGAFWSGLGYIASLFQFTEVSPRVVLEPFTVGEWTGTWIGLVVSLLLYGGLGAGAALGYYIVLRKLKPFYIGFGYGLGLFGIVFFILHPMFPSMPPLLELTINTFITSACLFGLFGLFIGYSISYENNELRVKSEKPVSH